MATREGGGRVLASSGIYIEVLDTWQNVGPILDAVLADTDGSGQVIILCAGILRTYSKSQTVAYHYCLWGHERW